MNIDSKSAKIIKAKYWRNGWLDEAGRVVSFNDASHLSENGWNLGSTEMSHDVLVRQVIDMSEHVEIDRCASLLSRSLPSRRVQDRSFLSSALQALKVPDHSHISTGLCPVCGLHGRVVIDQDLMPFEKTMWGGVRLTNMSYVWLDLKLFSRCTDLSSGTGELENLVREIAKSPKGLSASKFAASLKTVKGNKTEREILAGILGIVDILQHPEHPGFLDRYPAPNTRELPNKHFIDLEWPFCWYNSDYGVNLLSLEKLISTGANNLLRSRYCR